MKWIKRFALQISFLFTKAKTFGTISTDKKRGGKMYILLISIIYLAFISLGLPDSLLGAGWPVMQVFFGVPISYMGIISMIMSGGTILSSLMSERLTKKLGTQHVTVLSIFLTAIALFGFSHSTEFWQLCAWSVPYGLGAGAIDAALNNYVALHYSAKHMSWLHCFWGVGAIISPYVMSFALAYAEWSEGFRIVGILQIIIVVIMLITLPIWRINKEKTAVAEDSPTLGIKGVLRIKGASGFIAAFFSYCAAEATIMLWASSYLFQAKGLPEELAAALASLYYIGLTAGRFGGGFISDKLGDRKMIRIGTALAVFGLILLIMPNDVVAFVGFVVTGLGCAPIYPCFIHQTPATFGADKSQAIIGTQMALGYIGWLIMPPLFGIIANHITINLLPIFCLIFFALQTVLSEGAWRRIKK